MNGEQTEYTKSDIEFFNKLRASRTRKGEAINYIGVEIGEIGYGYATGRLECRPHHRNPIGTVHGGILFLFADSVGGTAASSRGSAVTTANGNIHFLRPAVHTKYLTAEARELKAGRNLLTYEVEIRGDDGRLIATATMEYFSLHRPIA